MTTPAQGNLSGSSSKRPDPAFEASGLTPEEAERLAAAFRPSWEFDEAPFTPIASAPPLTAPDAAGGFEQAHLHSLSAEDVARENMDARTVAPHSPPPRVETNEPEVSVIIDRSITAAEIEGQRPPPPPSARPAAPVVDSPFAAPAFVPAPASAKRVAPVMRGRADDSLELPTSLKKSNKGLFIGLGVAGAGGLLVLLVHGALSSSSEAATPSTTTAAATEAPTTTATTAAQTETHTVAIPPPPPPAATPTPMATTAPVPLVAATSLPVAAQPQRTAAPTPRPVAPHPAAPPAVHHPAARNPPKPASGGIVRDNPF